MRPATAVEACPRSGRRPRPAGRGRRAADGRRSLAVLLSGLAVFAALHAGLGAALTAGPHLLRDPDYGLRAERVRRRLRADPPPRAVVLLGSSRTLFGAQAATLEGTLTEGLHRPTAVFNFAVGGGGPVTELLTWRRLRRDRIRPDLVLIEVVPLFLSETCAVDETSAERLPAERLAHSDLGLVERYAGGRRPGLRRDWRAVALTAPYAHRFALLSDLASGLLPEPYREDRAVLRALQLPTAPPDPAPAERRRALEATRAEYAELLRDFRLGGRGVAALRELFTSCRTEGVRFALVLMPEGPTFRGWYAPGVWPRVRDWVGRVGREFDAPVIDAREWLDDDDFIDSHHMLRPGAAKFTRRLGRDELLPLLRDGEAPAGASGPGRDPG
jgi:hypothetical protein